LRIGSGDLAGSILKTGWHGGISLYRSESILKRNQTGNGLTSPFLRGAMIRFGKTPSPQVALIGCVVLSVETILIDTLPKHGIKEFNSTKLKIKV
jgi:hypothetical protein